MPPLTDKKRALKELWEVCRAAVLARDGYRCRLCGKGKADGRVLQGAHILPQGPAKYRAIRYDLCNLLTLCAYPCHLGSGGWHNNPHMAIEWANKELGADFIPKLVQLAAVRRNSKKLDIQATRIYLEQERDKFVAAYARRGN